MKRKRRKNPPVLVVNPKKRRRKRRRSAPRRRRRMARRRNPKSSGWADALITTLLGAGTGVACYGVSLGVDQIPLEAIPKTAIHAAGTIVLSPVLAKYADQRVAAAFAAGNAVAIAQSVRHIVALRQTGTSEGGSEASAVLRRRREAAAVARLREAAGPSSMRPGIFGTSFKEPVEAGRSFYVDGPIRRYGPRSWVYEMEAAGIRTVSAHNR